MEGLERLAPGTLCHALVVRIITQETKGYCRCLASTSTTTTRRLCRKRTVGESVVPVRRVRRRKRA